VLGGTFWGLLAERTSTIKSAKILKIKSQFLALMCVPFIVGVHPYL